MTHNKCDICSISDNVQHIFKLICDAKYLRLDACLRGCLLRILWPSLVYLEKLKFYILTLSYLKHDVRSILPGWFLKFTLFAEKERQKSPRNDVMPQLQCRNKPCSEEGEGHHKVTFIFGQRTRGVHCKFKQLNKVPFYFGQTRNG